ncbi:uncharacterized protein EDB93DRAFT_1107685 [Suillus bovinus]|uniref:uncharacterized protein n=1 Tax=Suillus bovinus TaxID=48563 RepID=UPI001B85C4BA|nr:uncharacterized protein EDB93DRAFT_1107685 [Suillus bovinus]KAG2132884.1 hypothetical protein EDB93DRAFT_1107685 [Suillus bovinus]
MNMSKFHSCPSKLNFNDAAEVLLMTQNSGSIAPSSHAKDYNEGAGYGQGCHTYSCGYYNYHKLLCYQAGATDLLDKAFDLDAADKLQNDLEDVDVWKSQCSNQLPLTPTHQKRKHSGSDFIEGHTQAVTPQRHFGHNILNGQRRASVPALPVSEAAPHWKWGKLVPESEALSLLSVAEALLKVAGGIEAAINRQTKLLSLILNANETQGGSTSD